MNLTGRAKNLANRTPNKSGSVLAAGRQDDTNDTWECKLLSVPKMLILY